MTLIKSFFNDFIWPATNKINSVNLRKLLPELESRKKQNFRISTVKMFSTVESCWRGEEKREFEIKYRTVWYVKRRIKQCYDFISKGTLN